MTLTRLLPLLLALGSAGALMGCATTAATPMAAGPAHTMASPERMAAMDAHMKTMHQMQAQMANAKTPAERQALMAAHMKAMQDGMGMMKVMASMHAMGDAKPTSAEAAEHHRMMAQHMAMMQSMMDMTMQRMPPP